MANKYQVNPKMAVSAHKKLYTAGQTVMLEEKEGEDLIEKGFVSKWHADGKKTPPNADPMKVKPAKKK